MDSTNDGGGPIAMEQIAPIAHSSFDDAAAAVAEIDKLALRRVTGANDRRIVWRSWGAGPPLVLIHGDFGSWTHWIRNVMPLAQRWRVIAVDLPGYGDSDSYAEVRSPESLAAILADSIGELLPPPERYSLAGFSFGGIIAAHLGAAEGARVSRLALFGPGGFGPTLIQTPALRRLTAEMETREIVEVHRHNLGKVMIADPMKIDDRAVFLQIENVRRARSRGGTIPQSDALLRALPRIRCGLDMIYGERDATVGATIWQREELARRFRPDLEFRIISSAGHWTPYEAAGEVNSILFGMLDGSHT